VGGKKGWTKEKRGVNQKKRPETVEYPTPPKKPQDPVWRLLCRILRNWGDYHLMVGVENGSIDLHPNQQQKFEVVGMGYLVRGIDQVLDVVHSPKKGCDLK